MCFFDDRCFLEDVRFDDGCFLEDVRFDDGCFLEHGCLDEVCFLDDGCLDDGRIRDGCLDGFLRRGVLHDGGVLHGELLVGWRSRRRRPAGGCCGAEPVMDAGDMMAQREHFGHAHGAVGDRLQQRLGGHLDGELDGVTVDRGIAVEEAGKRRRIADLHRSVGELSR